MESETVLFFSTFKKIWNLGNSRRSETISSKVQGVDKCSGQSSTNLETEIQVTF